MTYFSFVVVIFILCVSSSYGANGVKVVDVDTICKGVIDYTYCSNLLNSKPGKNRDLISFAEYGIGVARVNVTNTFNLIRRLIANSGSDVGAKKHYEICLYHFDAKVGALRLVDEAVRNLKTGDYGSARERAGAISVHCFDCVRGESPGETPFPDPSQLPKYAHVVIQISQILEHIFRFIIYA
ncbi:uncharacterized protein LOC131624209 [Vicia villosa]|uniref:uncharacterized protein LOC131624209 n=1 Tax=Vicia villosa TaxID=3911 RepID=UPI00273A9925|nr:uncharacterized protein LOC131624209 [Vicia villosa]